MKRIYIALQKTSRTTIILTSILFLVLLGISWVTVKYLTQNEMENKAVDQEIVSEEFV